MQSNKVEYSTAAGPYCAMHGGKVPFFMPELSRSNIIQHRFHVDNYIGESGIVYDMIIGHNLIVQLGLSANFQRQTFQWNGVTVPMKKKQLSAR